MIKNHSLEKNIVRLYNCYVLSQNQNDKLSYKIKKRLNKKIVELANDFIGGGKGWLWNSPENEKTDTDINSDTIGKYIKNKLKDIITTIIQPIIIKSIDDNKDNLKKIITDNIQSNIIKFIDDYKDNFKKIITDDIQPLIIKSIDDYKDNFKKIITDNIQPIIIKAIEDKKINITEMIKERTSNLAIRCAKYTGVI
jgi:hypothetical protein